MVFIVLIAFYPIAAFQDVNGLVLMHIDGIKGSLVNVFPNHIIGNQGLSEFLNYIPFILATLLLTVVLVSFFSFRDRKRQLKLNAIAMIVNMLLVISILYFTDLYAQHESIYPNYEYKMGAIFPIISILFLILANRGIRADEAKIKAADRIR
jgi:peptidoglycan/LPS O-acetylase OafA/YrhL